MSAQGVKVYALSLLRLLPLSGRLKGTWRAVSTIMISSPQDCLPLGPKQAKSMQRAI